MTRSPLSYRCLAWIFLRAGSVTYGGWPSTVNVLENLLIRREKRITRRQLDAAAAAAQVIPGASQVGIVTIIGFKLRGVTGAAIAATCYVLPALGAIAIFAVVYVHYLQDTGLLSRLDGLKAALGGVMLGNAYRLMRHHATHHSLLWLVTGVAFIITSVFKMHAAYIIAVAAGLGLIIALKSRKKGAL